MREPHRRGPRPSTLGSTRLGKSVLSRRLDAVPAIARETSRSRPAAKTNAVPQAVLRRRRASASGNPRRSAS